MFFFLFFFFSRSIAWDLLFCWDLWCLCKVVLLNLSLISGIYLHIPFCKKACAYCDFYFSTNFANKGLVVKAIAREIIQRHNYLPKKEITSIYFGGGTPSLLTERELSIIFEALENYFSWGETAEITLEANPDDITVDALRIWREAGVNRLSIGLQSFNEDELIWMNRAHTASESLSSVKLAQDQGFNNISVDLIYGSKFQNLLSWEKTLKTVVQLNTQHISSYNLTIEDKTLLGVKYRRGAEPPVDDHLSSQQFLMMLDLLESSGFEGYEISNFGKKDFFAVHNTNYWLQKPYLGLGPSAHSFDGLSRQWNVKRNSLYVKSLEEGSAFYEKEELTDSDRYNEYILTRLRTMWGCDSKEIEQLFGAVYLDHFKHQLAFIREFVIVKNGVVTLTREGKLRADGLSAGLFF